MQTFLPYPDFQLSCQCLDWKRLGKQRIEAKTILNILQNPGKYRGWLHHPATLMWKGYENALQDYYNHALDEWLIRGYKNSMSHEVIDSPLKMPNWMGEERFHASHRSNLLRKDPIYYSQFNWSESSDLPYFWPTEQGY